MQKLTLIIFALLAVMGCTNNGDIGPLYGQWTLQTFTADGESKADVACHDYSFKFQNNIVEICKQLGHNNAYICYGTWTLSGDELTLNFTHSSSASTSEYTPPAELGLPAQAITAAHVSELSSGKLKFEFTAPDGIKYALSLKKLR